MPSWASEYDFLLDRYQNGGDLGNQLNPIFYAAGYFLVNSEIYKNLDYAILVNEQLDRLRAARSRDGELRASLHLLFGKFYKHTIDDAAIVSAFENYAKAMLLKKRCIPHLVTSPNGWSKDQAKRPLHFLKYRAALRNGVDIKLSDKTLAVSILTQNSYLEKIGYSKTHKKAMNEAIDSRNKLHFMGVSGYSLKKPFFDNIVYLVKCIRKQTANPYPLLIS